MTSSFEDNIEQQIAKVSAFVETAQRLIFQNNVVDVHVLEEKTADLCRKLEEMPP